MKIKKKRYHNLFLLLALVSILSIPIFFVNCGKKKVIDKKQIILISIDTLRGDHISPYGYSRDTSPNLSRLVKDSVYYTKAYTNGCWTMPSHVSLLTGTLPSRHGVNQDWKSFIKKQYPQLKGWLKNIAEVLKPLGVKTIKYAYLPDELGFGKGFDKNIKIDSLVNNEIFGKILQDLEDHKEKNFFLFIHTWRVHAPYSNTYFLEEEKIDKEKFDYINNFRESDKNGLGSAPVFGTYLKENNLYNLANCMTLYDSSIHFTDRYIGKIIDKAKQLGIYKDLMFIVVSDHGEHFAEHFPGEFYNVHGKDFYEEFILVPLIIKYPRRYNQGIIDHPVSLIDVFPTVLDYYEIETPIYVQGESLLAPFSKRDRKYIISEAISVEGKEKKMILLGDLKYIITMENPSKAGRVNWEKIVHRRLFDLKNDPMEKNNLCKYLKFTKIRIDLEKMLSQIIKKSVKMNPSVKEAEITEETIKQLKKLGYLE